jgi:predicted small secreted protein
LTSVTVPSTVAPSLKVTVPVGTPAPDVTVELSVTACPTVEGFGVDVRLVDVAAAAGALTIWFTVGDELAANAGLPL